MDFEPLDRLRRSVFAVPLALLAALVVVVFNETGYNRSTQALGALAERGGARIELHLLMRGLIDSETGQRGYLLTARNEYLAPYNEGVLAVNSSIQKLADYFANDPASLMRVKTIEAKSKERLAELAATLRLHDEGKQDQWRAMLMTGSGKQTMDILLGHAEALIESENDRIVVQRQGIFDTLRVGRIGVNVMAAFALVALILFLRKTRMLERVQHEHSQTLRADRDQLEAVVTRRTIELTELAQHLESAREDERSRLARELHDELGALLTAAKLDAARLRRTMLPMSPATEEGLKHLHSTLDQGIALKRNIIENLRPSSLANLGLVAALEIQATEFAARAAMQVTTKLEPVALSDKAQITVYRLVQESLNNIAKHARATHVTIVLCKEDVVPYRVCVSVQDNGDGFDPTTVKRDTHGLTGMRYRVVGLGGTMTVQSTPAHGTVIKAWLPATHCEKVTPSVT